MATQIEVEADLRFEVAVPGRAPVLGTLYSAPSGLVLQVSDPQMFAGRTDAPAIRGLADLLASRGLKVHVHDGRTHLVSIGAIRAPWWQRRLTGSRHIRLGSLRGAWTSARSRARTVDTPVLPDATMLPPATMFPLAPTFMRRPPRRVTTTNDPLRGGNPRLILAPGQAVGREVGRERRSTTYWLEHTTTLGSGPDCDIRLPGLAELHATITQDDNDEYVLTSEGPEVRVHGERTDRRVLRTGSRVDLGKWVLTYYREEYADHGRPYSGRVGGEFGRQRKQPPTAEG
ncbi:FHA domain-containing protein [Nocardioides sp.]|uniref:FHA domain-containing protein n=1 Tax=Nocardioides sp. TaxID=35761 RepID=UPI003D0DAC49